MTITDFATAVRAVAAGRPDHVQASCRYVQGDVPHCLIGHALAQLGVPLSDLADADTRMELNTAMDLMREVLPDVPLRTRLWANAVQRHADVGATWGQAVQHADEELPSA